MADAGRREPAADESLHPVPRQSSLLAAPAKDAMPVVTDRETEVGQGGFLVLRQTLRKRLQGCKLQAKLREVKAELWRRMHAPVPETGAWLRSERDTIPTPDGLALIASNGIILVEALIDALTLWCAGYRQVTASYGNGFTQDHRAAFEKHGTERAFIGSPPTGLLQSYRAITLQQRERNQSHAARDRTNTGVSVLTDVNARGIRQLRERTPVRLLRK